MTGFSVEKNGSTYRLYCSNTLYDNSKVVYLFCEEGSTPPNGYEAYEPHPEVSIDTLAEIVLAFGRRAFSRLEAISIIVGRHKELLDWSEEDTALKVAELVTRFQRRH